uniref:Uncharacterized protein n=1 Tax=Opuntia streptacantha TaxID=393608 RepID=A0A7C9EX29_OPUST
MRPVIIPRPKHMMIHSIRHYPSINTINTLIFSHQTLNFVTFFFQIKPRFPLIIVTNILRLFNVSIRITLYSSQLGIKSTISPRINTLHIQITNIVDIRNIRRVTISGSKERFLTLRDNLSR